MSKVLAIRYTDDGKLPDVPEKEFQQLQDTVMELLEQRDNIEFNGTYVNEEGIGVCEWDAPSAEDVQEIYEEAGVNRMAPADDIIEVDQAMPL